ncbi:hypothetical protein Xmau_01068 [Xenorhabdus mauleonii]|uniref:Uncharacterized conserved protein YdgA, DUF945 family n=1 Tax=Xenorhabdus mauleonii TaxID=351675 RepID=A0A1I3M6M3_9GAMM|nr:YdgA family protein [Xenorhabdus mauleonii]PHM45418.1 hypothetical protein Xmau_01068 [Xenorhabdus mauleonii]SFI92699.1 Uncharacterized conserved protein YdgA, DUF945 family [Xenorhabdus mauleonii]
MKKSLVAVSVVVALGVVWSGASWLTGKKIEDNLNEYVKNANSELKNAFPDSGIELQAKDFKRGIFSSDVNLVLNIKKGVKNVGIEPNEEVIFKSNIDHGPFPLENLKKFNLMPKMATLHAELEKNKELEKLFDITDGKSLLNLNTSVGYTGNLSTDIELIPINHEEAQKDGEKNVFSFSGAKIVAETSRDLSSFSFKIKSDELSITTPAKNEAIILKDINFTGDNKKGNFDFYIGNQNYNIGEITVRGKNNEESSLKGFNIASDLSEDKNNLNIKLAYSVDGMIVKNINLGSGKFTLKMEKLDGPSVRKFTQAYNDDVAEALSSNELSSDVTTYAILNNAHLLFNKSPQLSISPFSWKNSKGESMVDFKLALQNIPENKDTLNTMPPEEMIRTLVQDLSLRINIPKAMLIESIAQADELDGKDKATAEAQATLSVQMIAKGGEKFITDKDDVLGLNFNYSNDKVELNGKESSLHQFLLDNGLADSYDGTDGEQNQHDETEKPVAE